METSLPKMVKCKCSFCDSKFIAKSKFHRYIIEPPAGNDQYYKCCFCENCFTAVQPTDFENRKRTPGPEKTFPKRINCECLCCGSKFKAQGDFQRFMINLDTDQELYKCNFCENCFGATKDIVIEESSNNIDVEPRKSKNPIGRPRKIVDQEKSSNQIRSPMEIKFADPRKSPKRISSRTKLVDQRKSPNPVGRPRNQIQDKNSADLQKLLKKPVGRPRKQIPKKIIAGLQKLFKRPVGRPRKIPHNKENFTYQQKGKDSLERSEKQMEVPSEKLAEKVKAEPEDPIKSSEDQIKQIKIDESEKTNRYVRRPKKEIQDGFSHTCTVCLKSFSTNRSLLIHMRVHTGEKPYECPKCFKKFSQSGNLQLHMIIHNGRKPFKCQICRKAFNTARSLKRHALIHNNVKPFTCQTCNRSFRERSKLKRHQKSFGHDEEAMPTKLVKQSTKYFLGDSWEIAGGKSKIN